MMLYQKFRLNNIGYCQHMASNVNEYHSKAIFLNTLFTPSGYVIINLCWHAKEFQQRASGPQISPPMLCPLICKLGCSRWHWESI